MIEKEFEVITKKQIIYNGETMSIDRSDISLVNVEEFMNEYSNYNPVHISEISL